MFSMQKLRYGGVIFYAAIVMYGFYLMSSTNSESFCTCQGMSSKRCPDPEILQDLYNTGKLTEYSDLAGAQSPQWMDGGMPGSFQPYAVSPKCGGS
jgi:hypothetical protein